MTRFRVRLVATADIDTRTVKLARLLRGAEYLHTTPDGFDVYAVPPAKPRKRTRRSGFAAFCRRKGDAHAS